MIKALARSRFFVFVCLCVCVVVVLGFGIGAAGGQGEESIFGDSNAVHCTTASTPMQNL